MNESKADVLIVHGELFTMAGDGVGYVEDGAVAVKGDRILDVGPTERLSSTYVADVLLDATGKAVLPGLIDSHTHSQEALLRGVAQDVRDYMARALAPFSRAFRQDLRLAGTRLHVLEALKAGTTTFMDFASPFPGWAEFYESVGVRARLTPRINGLADNAMSESSGEPYRFDDAKGAKSIDEAMDFAETWDGTADRRISVMLGPQAPDMVSVEHLQHVKRLAESHDLMIHMHVAQGDREIHQVQQRYGQRSIAFLESMGYLDEQLFAVHLTEATEEEVETMVQRRATMGLCSGCIGLVDGIVPPAYQYRGRGGYVGLGSDSASSNNIISLFNEMKLTALFNKIARRSPEVMPAWEVLRMATIEGAHAIGLGGSIGSVEIGKQADIIMVDLRSLNLCPVIRRPIRNLVPNLVYAATGQEVETVLVAGRVLMEGRIVQTADEETVREDAQEAAEELNRLVLGDPRHRDLALLDAMDRGWL